MRSTGNPVWDVFLQCIASSCLVRREVVKVLQLFFIEDDFTLRRDGLCRYLAVALQFGIDRVRVAQQFINGRAGGTVGNAHILESDHALCFIFTLSSSRWLTLPVAVFQFFLYGRFGMLPSSHPFTSFPSMVSRPASVLPGDNIQYC